MNEHTLFDDVLLRHLEGLFCKATSQLSEVEDFSTPESRALVQNVLDLELLCIKAKLGLQKEALFSHHMMAESTTPETMEQQMAGYINTPNPTAPAELPTSVSSEATPSTNTKTYTKEEVKAIIIPLAAKFTDPGQMPKILKEVTGADRLSDVPEEKYPELIAAVRKAAEA